MKRIDLTGQHIGRWYIHSYAGRRNDNTHWHCRCACGTERIVSGKSLTTGRSQSCGCLRREQRLTPAQTLQRSRELYQAGYTLAQVAAALQYAPNSHGFISTLLDRQGIARRSRHTRPRVSSARLLTLYGQLGTYAAVGRATGLDAGGVRIRILRYQRRGAVR
ncbi:MAG TPA: hypothetical protein VFT66_15470 [Roseiflexaceae bacterium]|nr:hypothetical protein [Roseiflexaceae bacterium]